LAILRLDLLYRIYNITTVKDQTKHGHCKYCEYKNKVFAGLHA